jgi:hypothetical protein
VLRPSAACQAPVKELAALRHARDFELAPGNESIEQYPQRGGAQLVPEDAHVLVIRRVEVGDANPSSRPLHRERPLFSAEVVDGGVEHIRELRPNVGRNVIEGGHEAMTVGARPDTTL